MKRIGNWIIMHKSEQEWREKIITRESLNIFKVAEWVKADRLPDELMKSIVRRVYDGKRTVHKNPTRKKVTA